MTTMKKSKLGAVILVALLLACALVVTVSAAEEKNVVRTVADEAQLKTINELYGKDITVLDYMEKVHPEHLAGVKDSIKENMARQTMMWWGKEPSVTDVSADRMVRTLRATVMVTASGYKVDYRTIRYSGTCRSSISNPSYIYVDAALINSQTGQTVASTSVSSSAGLSQVSAQQDKLYPANGQYYTHAWGYTASPNYAEDEDTTAVFIFP